MSFNKKFPKAKDARKRMHKYYKSKRFDTTCRTGGSCGWCQGNRTRSTDKRLAKAKDSMVEFERGHEDPA